MDLLSHEKWNEPWTSQCQQFSAELNNWSLPLWLRGKDTDTCEGGRGERRIQFHPPLASSWQPWKTSTNPWLLGNMSCFCWGADRRLTSAVHAATYWPWREEVKWRLWTLSSELSLPCSFAPGFLNRGGIRCVDYVVICLLANCFLQWKNFI